MQKQKQGGGIAPPHSQAGNSKRWLVSTTLRQLCHGERRGTQFTGAWAGLATGLRCMKTALHWYSYPKYSE